ncbi:MAG: bifunctional histidinol-phosphatase/imidazoleglycerol-phosphate dehydratase HisB [Candidatus Amulumruptor sp.]|nr:bifunctional histidinol-phosphatase/imidazoleglycerol-phosphate dehydratase HisB [Candidatus Amulumruptor sp.]
MKKAIFIDRDGTILTEPADEQIDSLEKLRFVPGVISALRALAGKGYELVMVSNQDGLGTASFPEETFWPAHNMMLDTLRGEGVEFDDILIDRSFPQDNSPTRKPRTGMLCRYMDGSYNLGASFVIGDRLTDMELAVNLGAQGIMVGESSELPQGCVMASSDWMKIARHILSTGRDAHIVRNTSETKIDLYLNLDGGAPSRIDTGLKFYDHMLNQIPHHGGVTLNIICRGDLDVDEHHTMEDVAIALGEAISQALGSKRGIERYGFVLPMDESRAMVLIDFSGRSELVWDVNFTREYVGDTPTEMYEHLFKSLASAMHANLYVAARGKNNHHIIEGVFKAFARALRQAVSRNPFSYDLPSSKGVL